MKWDMWLVLGFAAQGLFFMRFFVQWLSSEIQGKSVVPLAFWYFSILGGSLLFIYSLHIKDPVFILGQGLGILIYIRNLMLIRKDKTRGTLKTK
jgi:lipid-A-disaccharide synthase-like uncharacterized protein